MRRLPSVLLLGALAISTLALAPAPGIEAPDEAERQIIVCVRFQDWEVPVTGITWEAPHERLCVETRDVVVPFPGGNPAPDHLPSGGGRE